MNEPLTLDPSPIEPDDLRAGLKDLGISYAELASMIGVTKTTVSNWARGVCPLVGPAAVSVRIIFSQRLTVK